MSAARRRGAMAVVTGAALGASLMLGTAMAQQADGGEDAPAPADDARSMSLDELETHIAEQKEVLEAVRENRSATEQRAEAAEQRLSEREQRIEQMRQELDTLCREREEVAPGKLQECLAALQD